MSKKKIDEGLVKLIGSFLIDGEGIDEYEVACAIQSYLKKEGYVKLPGKYVVKKGCLVKID